jgi:LSD1 subclass zinc finger protein
MDRLMPIVRCPSCRRALNLPESADISTAKCPLCQTTFDVPREPPRSAPPAADVIRPIGRAVPHPEPSVPRFEDRDDLLPRADRLAVASACAWMKGAGILGAVHLFFCGCVSFAFLGGEEAAVFVYCTSYVFQLVASIVVYNGATALHRRTSPGWVMTAGVVAVILGVLSLLLALPVFAGALHQMELPRRRNAEDAILVGVALLLNLAVIVSFLVAGVKALRVLRRPGVRRGFLR